MLDWTTIIVKAYWPLVVLFLLLSFREKISKLIFKTTYGELLVELNAEKSIIDKKYNKLIKRLDTTDIWLLWDIKEERTSMISKMNPVQKFAYKKMIKGPFIEKRDDRIFLTETGEKVIKLAQSMEI